MRAEYQVAQKLHACTATLANGKNDRARDLVDLHLLAVGADLRETRSIALRLFQYRRSGTWPPAVIERDGWVGLYDDAAQGLALLSSVSEAITWANEVVQRIDAAT